VSCRELHSAGGVGFYVTSIVEDNSPARRLLTANLPGFPTYCELGRMITFVLESPGAPASGPLWRAARRSACRRSPPPRRVLRPVPARSRVDRRGARLGRGVPRAPPEDFLLVERGGKLQGCAAVWDQRPFKQTVIRGYGDRIARTRPLLNAAAASWGAPACRRSAHSSARLPLPPRGPGR